MNKIDTGRNLLSATVVNTVEGGRVCVCVLPSMLAGSQVIVKYCLASIKIY